MSNLTGPDWNDQLISKRKSPRRKRSRSPTKRKASKSPRGLRKSPKHKLKARSRTRSRSDSRSPRGEFNPKSLQHRSRSPRTHKHYRLLDAKGARTGHEFSGTSPFQAALKAASRGHKNINLLDGTNGKIHSYKGSVRTLKPSEQNETTRERGIHHKPVVEKIRK